MNKELSKQISSEFCYNCGIEGDRAEDNLNIFDDGHKRCYACNFYVTKDGKEGIVNNGKVEWLKKEKKNISEIMDDINIRRFKRDSNKTIMSRATENTRFISGEVEALEKRRLTFETCKFFNIKMGYYSGYIGKGQKQRKLDHERVRVFSYFNDQNKIIAQHIKTRFNEYKLLGSGSDLPLYGKWLYTPTEKLFIVVTEGVEDCASVGQVMGLQYPVVSIPTGAASALEALKRDMQFLSQYKYVVLGLDNDEAGNKALQQILDADIFLPGKIRIAKWKLKDANEMLQQRMEKEISECVWQAKEYAPNYIVTVSDVLEETLKQPQWGRDYPWKEFTDLTYGRKGEEVYVLAGPPSAGKTEILSKIIFHALENENELNCGIFSFEHSSSDTLRRYIGNVLHRKLHIPENTKWDKEDIEIMRGIAMGWNNRLFFYNRTGSVDINALLRDMRYEAIAKNCRLFVVDNVKALGLRTKTDYTDFMNRLKALMFEVKADTWLVSHLDGDKIKQSTHVGFSSKVSDPYGGLTESDIKRKMGMFKLDWENGRMPTSSEIEGFGVLPALANYCFVCSRNKESEDPHEKNLLRLKCIKHKLNSLLEGTELGFYYNDKGDYEVSKIEKELKPEADDEEGTEF